ncbi:hypothetical protein BESB_057150 [Besnoitia besnoiti]|uniref:Uncharacterized protein n=1 Tax=Besnoitia besnoiti TaxID=94643 RepID=A0A2A9MFV3_BESBE|nr:hypothetical protein BESB_057150 [Besnoitia besnoiti]PFH36064.1 hypothetical protein BESB_057150 [Besnoitia besnoiti]
MAAKHQSVTESVMAAAPRSLPARRAYPDADRRELLQEPSLMQQPAEDPPFKTLVSLLNSSWMASDVFQRSGEQALADQSLALAEDKNPKSGTTGVASEFLQMLPLFPIASEPALFVDLRTFAIRMCGMSSKPWNEKPKFEAGAPPTKDESTQLDSSHMYRNVEHDRADVDEATLQVISIDWSAIRQVKRAENPPWRDNSWHSSSGPENGTDLKSVRDSARVSGAQTTASYTSHSLPWDSQVRKSSGSPLPQETILPSQSGQNKETGVFLNRGPPEAVVKSRPTVVAYGQAPGSTEKLVPRVTLNAQSPSSLSWSSNNTRQPDNGGPSTRDGRLSSVAATFASAARAAEQATSEADQLDVNFSYSPPSEAPGSERERLHGEGKLPGAPEKHGWIALLRCIRKREDGAEEKVNAASIERSGQTLSAGSSNAPEAELLVENALLGLVPVHLVPAPKAVQNHILKSTKAGHDSRGDLHASTGGLGEGANNDSDSERSSGFMPSSREGIVSDLSPRSINPFLNTAPRHAVLRWAAPEARAWVEGMLLSRGRLTQDHALRKDSPVFAFTSASEPGNQMIPDGEKRRHASEHEQHPRARRIQQTNHKEKRRESGDAVPRWSHLSGYLRKDKQPADEGGEGGVELPVWVLDVPIHKIMEVRNNGKSSPDCSLRAGMRQTGTPPNAANMDGLPAACGASAFWHPSVGRPLSAQLHLDGFREQCRLLRRRSAERNGTAEQTKSPVGNAGRTKYPSCGTDLQDMDMIVMLAGVESPNPRDTDERADARSKAALSRLRFPQPSTVPKEQSHSKWTETLTNDSSRKICGTSPMHVAEHGEDTLWVKCYRGWPETLHTVSLTGPELSLGDDIPIPVFMGGFTSNR